MNSEEPLTEVSFVIQKRNTDEYPDWTDEGDESPAAEPLRERLDELRTLWGHDTEYRVARVKRKALDW